MKNRPAFLLTAAIASLGLSACQDTIVEPITGVTAVATNFNEGTDGWVADYTDYTEDVAGTVRFQSGLRPLPTPLNTDRKAFFLSSNNPSDDVFMFLKRRITGLRVNTEYKLTAKLQVASKYPNNVPGIGGAPGQALYLKVGASLTEPKSVLTDDGYRLNVDKGNQVQTGKATVLLGDASNDSDSIAYKLVDRTNDKQPLSIKTDATGELWLFFGTDSGYEGQTDLYYTRVAVTATPTARN